MRAIRRLLVVLAILVAAGGAAIGAGAQQKATPPSQVVDVPSEVGPPQTYTWSGTIPPGSNPVFDGCDGAPGADTESFDIRVPNGAYDRLKVTYKFEITWTPVTSATANDLKLQVINPAIADDSTEGQSRTVGSSDGGEPKETVTATNLTPARYDALTCAFANADNQPYTGKLTVTTEPGGPEPSLSAAPANGLDFTASVIADPQRRASEPIIEVDDDGTAYTCGPSGVTTTEYAQASTDGGDQFNALGEGPQYRPTAVPGGGDCGLAVSPFRDATSKRLPFALTGLGPLTNFVTAASDDNGQTLRSGNSNSVPGVDRQWMAFVDPDTVLLAYNQQQPRQIVVQRSTDRGVTYGTSSVPASPVNPLFPGPMRSLPASLNPAGADKGNVAFFAFDDFDQNVYLSVSTDQGRSFKNCLVAKQPGESTLFATADADSAGNIYVAYGENVGYHSYVTVLTHDKLKDCDNPVSTVRGQQREFSTKNPGFSTPVQVDREGIRTTVFPWVAAGGEPGRVALSFYGTQTDGNPDLSTFKASWNVYVNQSLDLLRPKAGGGFEPNPNPTFSQVKATTHPLHFDSICLGGLSCSTSGGDRTLADFFAMDYNPASKRLQVTYNQSYKQPDKPAGEITIAAVLTQRAGPSNGGGDVATDPRPVLRDSSADPRQDAIADFSTVAPTPKTPRNEPAMDFESVTVSPEIDPATGARADNGGFTVTMKLTDLRRAALDSALAGPNPGPNPTSRSQSLLWLFRFANGYRTAGASARWNPSQGFTFGFNGYQRAATVPPECANSSCQVYRGEQPIKGKVDEAAGTIVLSVPRDKLKGLAGPEGPGERPAMVDAAPGTRFYDGTAFSLGNVESATQGLQGFLLRFDNTPSMDFELPRAAVAPTTTPAPPAASTLTPLAPAGSTQACAASAALRSVAVRPRRRGALLGFSIAGASRATVDVFQQSRGRRVIGERLVARFDRRAGSFTWNGRANRPGRRVTDGYFIVRYRAGGDVRRLAVRRVRGHFSRRPAYAGRQVCTLLRSAKLERPVFGGPANQPLRIAYRLTRTAGVRVEIRRAGRLLRVVRRRAAAGRFYRERFPSPARGDYSVRIIAGNGVTRRTVTLVARRL